ncbi:MAG TPA: ATP-binding protein [Trebonia sp.]|nr:ATP-binding protein [Trebonia sp.]
MTDPILDSLRAALAARPDDTALRMAVARRLLEGGDLAGAMAEAAEALRHDPASDEARDFMLSALSAPPPPPPVATPEGASSGDGNEPVLAGKYDWVAAEHEVSDLVGPRFSDEGQDAFDTQRPTLRLADVGGMEAVKARLEVAFLAPLRNPELRRLYGKSLRGGLLLYGPPGCGKTFLARAVAGEMGARFIVVGIPEILDMYIGQSERNLHEVFTQARRSAPCVLFLDEVDALGQKRSQLRNSAARGIVNQLLAEMDSVAANNEGLFVLGATNQPWDVDAALRRPGRFDRTVLVLPPDPPARAAILQYHLRARPVEKIELAALVTWTSGFSGADLAHLCETAAERALIDSARSGVVRMIGMPDFEAALREVRPSTGPWFSSARGVAMFANEGGAYDELIAYFREHPNEF